MALAIVFSVFSIVVVPCAFLFCSSNHLHDAPLLRPNRQQHHNSSTTSITDHIEYIAMAGGEISDNFSEIFELISIPAGKGKVMTRRANFVGLDGSRSLTLRTDHRWERRQGRCCRRWKDSKIAQREGISTLLHIPMSNTLTDFLKAGLQVRTHALLSNRLSPKYQILLSPSMRDVEQNAICDASIVMGQVEQLALTDRSSRLLPGHSVSKT